MAKKLILTIIILLFSVLTVFQFIDENNVDDEQHLIETPIESVETVSTRTETEELERPNKEDAAIVDVEVNQANADDNFIYDLYYKALELKTAAELGGAEAQLELAQTIEVCEDLVVPTPVTDNFTIEDPYAIELIDWWLSRCSGFNRSVIEDLGDSQYWYQEASGNGSLTAEVYLLLKTNTFPRNDENLAVFHKLIESQTQDAFQLLAIYTSDDILRDAWALMTCSAGMDCSQDSKELWKVNYLLFCSIDVSLGGIPCSREVSFQDYIQLTNSQENFAKILSAKKNLENIIANGSITSLQWENIIDIP